MQSYPDELREFADKLDEYAVGTPIFKRNFITAMCRMRKMVQMMGGMIWGLHRDEIQGKLGREVEEGAGSSVEAFEVDQWASELRRIANSWDTVTAVRDRMSGLVASMEIEYQKIVDAGEAEKYPAVPGIPHFEG